MGISSFIVITNKTPWVFPFHTTFSGGAFPLDNGGWMHRGQCIFTWIGVTSVSRFKPEAQDIKRDISRK